MSLTFEQCQKIVRRTLASLPADLDVVRLVNNAGRYLCSLHPWQYLLRYGTVQLVTDQVYAVLPTDFRSLKAVPQWGDVVLELVDPQRLLDVRNNGGAVAPPDDRYLCTVIPTWPDAGGEVTYTLHFWPTPEVPSGDPGLIAIYYLSKWRTVTDDDEANNHIVTMPDYLEGLFEELLRSYARGIEEEDTATLNQRLAEIEKGPLLAAAIRAEGSVQSAVGVIRNGAAQMAMGRQIGPMIGWNIPLGDPT